MSLPGPRIGRSWKNRNNQNTGVQLEFSALRELSLSSVFGRYLGQEAKYSRRDAFVGRRTAVLRTKWGGWSQTYFRCTLVERPWIDGQVPRLNPQYRRGREPNKNRTVQDQLFFSLWIIPWSSCCQNPNKITIIRYILCKSLYRILNIHNNLIGRKSWCRWKNYFQ